MTATTTTLQGSSTRPDPDGSLRPNPAAVRGAAFPARDDELWNRTRYVPGQKRGHYESFYQRANHPTRPLAFWIRYTLFSPHGRPEAAIGELWAVFFDGETGEHVAVKEEYPLAECHFDRHAFAARIGDRELAPGRLTGVCSSFGDTVAWDLTYGGGQPPLLLLPRNRYEGGFPKAKSLVGTPLANYQGELVVNGRRVDIRDWVGSQNHNWGSRHTDHYAFGQVAGFDDAPESFLEIVSARLKFGPVRTPMLTPLVLRHRGREHSLVSPLQSVRAEANFGYFFWDFASETRDVRIEGRISAPPGGVRRAELLQPARRDQTLPEHQDRALRAEGHGQVRRDAGRADCRAPGGVRDPDRRPGPRRHDPRLRPFAPACPRTIRGATAGAPSNPRLNRVTVTRKVGPMDPRNRFHTRTTYRIVRAEHVALLAICGGLVLWQAGQVNWWRALAAFWVIDLVGYLPGAVAFRRSPDRRISPWFHHSYNFAHTYLVTGTGVAAWAWAIGGFEWAMLAVPIHLSIDRGIFGNTLKPTELSFEPQDHSDEVVLTALGRRGELRRQAATEVSGPVTGSPREAIPEEVLTDVLEHPSGYLALSKRNQAFVLDGAPGFISYRTQGKHLWLFGGVHARPEHAGELLDGFLRFAAERRCRVAAVQVRQSQTDLFASRGFTVNQLGTTFAVPLENFSMAGGQKMQLRNKVQRARRLGLKVVELGVDVPRDAGWFERLAEVSARWLEGKGRKELDFMIGELGGPEDRDRRVFLVLDAGERPVAFITYVPVWGNERPGYLHDLTRRVPDAPAGAMELCNAAAIERFKAEGVKYLHFGFTPFIIDPEEARPASRLVHRVVEWLRRYGRRLYPADSQAAYKVKWGAAVTEREYIAFHPFSVRAVVDLLMLTRSV